MYECVMCICIYVKKKRERGMEGGKKREGERERERERNISREEYIFISIYLISCVYRSKEISNGFRSLIQS